MQRKERKSLVKKTGSKQKSGVHISSCKPCSVLLERLSEDEVRNLCSGSSLGIINRRENPTKRRSSRKSLPPTTHESMTGIKRRTKLKKQNFEESKNDCSRKVTGDKNLNNSVDHKRLTKVKSRTYVGETYESDGDSLSNNFEKRIEEFRNSLRVKKLGNDSSTDHAPRKEDRGKKISRNKDPEEPVYQSKLLASQGHKLLLQKKGSKTGVRTEDSSSGISNSTSSKDPEHKILPLNRFSLSLKKKRANLDDGETSGENSQRTISNSEDLDKISEGGQLQIADLKQMLKRKIIDSTDAEPSGSKLKKYDKKQSHNDKEDDKAQAENNRSGQQIKTYSPRDREVQSNKISEQELSPKVGNKVPNAKNLKVSLIKLELMANLPAREQEDNFKPPDRYTDVSEKDRDSRSEIVETQSKNMVESSPTKNRSTKITDYFFKVDKKTFLNNIDKKKSSKPNKDLVLKEKYGICKDPVIALVNLKQKKTPVSRYSASENKELIEEPDSSINLNYKSRTAIEPSSSSVSPGNKLLSSFKESSPNYEQSLANMTHVPSVKNRPEKELPPVSLLPTNHESSRTKKPSPAKSTEPSTNDNSYLKFHTPRSRRASNNADCVEGQEISEKDSRSGKNLSELRTEEQPLLTTANEVGNHLSDSPVDEATPKSLEIVSSQSKTLALTPGTRLVLTTDDHGMNETRSPVTEMNEKSPRINVIQEKQDSLTQRSSEVPPDGNEPQEKPDDTSDVDKDLNTVADQRVSVIRSPVIGGRHLPHAKQKTQRRLPVNSMTFISRDIIDDNSAWVDLLNTIDSSDKTDTTTKENCTVRDNESTEMFPNDNTQVVREKTKEKKLDSTSTMRELLPEATETTKRFRNDDTQVVRKETGEKKLDSISTMPELVPEARGKNLSAERPVSENIEPCSSGLFQKKVAEIQQSALASETESSVSSVEILETISTDEDSTDPKNSTEVRESTSAVIEYLISKIAENVSPLRSVRRNVGPYSSKGNMLVQEKIGDIQHSDAALGIETSVPSIGISEPISPTEASSEPILAEGADQGRHNSKSQADLRTGQEEGDLFIDVEERASDPPSAKSVVSSNLATIGESLPAAAVNKAGEILTKMKCILCNKMYKHRGTLEKHLQLHVKSTEDRCSICDKQVVDENIYQHYLNHCSTTSIEAEPFICHVCDQRFKRRSNLGRHLRIKHHVSPKNQKKKMVSMNVNHNKCTVCLLACNSAEDLFTHMRAHIGRELQDAYKVAKAKQQLRHSSTTVSPSEASDTSEKEKSVEKEQVASESAEPDNISKDSEVSVCPCHKEERLEMSGGVIIELALACVQCKTFFKTSKCFKAHYSNTSCKWSSNNVVTPKLFCNKCCVILNCLGELHSHLTEHGEVDVEMKTSFLCKRCNMFYFGIGDLFYAHWFEHWNNPLFVADHRSFPNNMRVNIVEPELTEGMTMDEPTQSLFIAEYQCQACQTPFQIEANLKKHLSLSKSCSEKVAQDPKLYYKLVCSMCHKEYAEKSSFDNHIEEHKDISDFLRGPKGLGTSMDSPLTCSICKTTYDTVTKYREHLIGHKIMQEKFFCNHCTLMMDSLEDFERHCTEHKGTQEKPVACKVVFAKAKFHCERCIIRFDNETLLNKHLATHSNVTTSDPMSVDSTPTMMSVIEKRSPVCTPSKRKLNDEVKLDGNVSIHNEDAPGESRVSPVVIDLSDDSNSTDIEIIENVENKQGEEDVAGNNLDQEKRKTEDRQETEKPVFLRVKNLKELLPFNCKVCKAEFDTPSNLSKHVCTSNVAPVQVYNQDVVPAKEKDFTYFCTICKKYQCNNDAEWIRHVLSHFPLQSSPTFSDSWFHVSKQPNGQQEFTCKICGHYRCLTIHTMRHHFIIVHPNIYRPFFKCRICHTFETESENEIRRHESAHFRQPSSLVLRFLNPDDNLSSLQPVEQSNNSQQLGSIPPATNSPNNSSSLQQASSIRDSRQLVQNPPVSGSGNNSPMFQVMKNFTTSQQAGPTPPVFTPGDIAPLLQVLRNFTNTPRTLQTSPLSNPGNNSSSLQPVQSFNHPQQPVQPVTSSDISSSTFQLVKNFNNPQQPVQLPPVTSSGNSSSLQQVNNFNSTQQPRSIPSLISLSNNLQPSQPIDSSNNSQQSVLMTPATTTVNNLSSVQQLHNFNNSQQALQPTNNWNKFQQPVSVPPVMSSANSLSSYQSIDNSQWLTRTAGTLQIQINNTPPYNNMTNAQVMHTVPLYVAVYCCGICKNFKCSSAEELKAHESLHDVSPMEEPSQNCYRCKVCTNVFYSSKEHLKTHMEICHITDQSNGAKNQTQSNPSVTDTQIKCRNCFQAFETPNQLIQHVYTCHKLADRQPNNTQFPHVRPFSCQLCSTVFVNEGFLRDHIKQHHPDPKLVRPKTNGGKNLYQCSTCGLLLISEETLSYHMKSHNIGFQ